MRYRTQNKNHFFSCKPTRVINLTNNSYSFNSETLLSSIALASLLLVVKLTYTSLHITNPEDIGGRKFHASCSASTCQSKNHQELYNIKHLKCKLLIFNNQNSCSTLNNCLINCQINLHKNNNKSIKIFLKGKMVKRNYVPR